jgi:hypothetical protein
MTAELILPLAGFAVVFALCWVLFLGGHAALASLGILQGIDRRIVALAVFAALASSGVTWMLPAGWFGSAETRLLSSLAAPFSFLGFCGIYILIGPVTVDRSITLAMLIALIEADTKGLSRTELQAKVPFDRIFGKRIRELEASGTLRLAGQVELTPRGARILRLYVWLGRVFRVNFQ